MRTSPASVRTRSIRSSWGSTSSCRRMRPVGPWRASTNRRDGRGSTDSMVALVTNRWNLFVRLANPHKHHEAITSRPLLLHGVATKTQHGGQTTLTITSQHAKQATVQLVLTRLAAFLGSLKSTAVDGRQAAGPHLATRVCEIPPRTNLSGCLIGARIEGDGSDQLPFFGGY